MPLSKLSETPIGPMPSLYSVLTRRLFTPIPNVSADAQRMFIPPTPSSMPIKLFSVQVNGFRLPSYRFIRKTDHEQMLIFVGGSSVGNESPTARAGFGVVFAPLQWHPPTSERLEQDGNAQTKNRAELRAVLAALGSRWWFGEFRIQEDRYSVSFGVRYERDFVMDLDVEEERVEDEHGNCG